MPDASGGLRTSDHSRRDGVEPDSIRYSDDDPTAMSTAYLDAPRASDTAAFERNLDTDQNQWPTDAYEPTDLRNGDAGPDHAFHEHGNEGLFDPNFLDLNYWAGPNQDYYTVPSQNMHNNIEAFEHTFQHPSEQYVPPSVSFTDTPRFTALAIDAAARPWSPRAPIDAQSFHTSTDALLFEPGNEVPIPQVHFTTRSDQEPLQEGRAADTNDLVMSDDNIDPPPDPDPVGPPSLLVSHETVQAAQDIPSDKVVRGRRHGAMKPQNKKHANSTRKKSGQCWNCSLQRNVCESDSEEDDGICKGCKSRRKISLIPGCIRVKLPDLTTTFIPGNNLMSQLEGVLQLNDRTASLAEQHDIEKLRSFTRTHVRRWLENHFLVWVTPGLFRPFKCEVTEIEPVGATLLYQDQNRLNLSTNQYDLVSVPSPPVGMKLMDFARWRTGLKDYVEEAFQENIWRIPDVCFQGDDSRVARALLLSISRYDRSSTGKVFPRGPPDGLK
ncbi:MAG: hypothetical protein Q9222_001662 [Ikaeria aurantiellina]